MEETLLSVVGRTGCVEAEGTWGGERLGEVSAAKLESVKLSGTEHSWRYVWVHFQISPLLLT